MTGEGWKFFKEESAKEELISLAYINYKKDKDRKMNRVHQILKLYLFSASSGMFSCPLAMTDGAISVLL